MFRTEIPFTPHSQPLSLAARVLTIGSCFSDVLGNRLGTYKVKSLTNPFGTVFNPLSACKLLRAAAGEETDWQQHLVPARGRWQSYDLHATVGADSPVELLQHIQEEVQRTSDFLQTADLVVFTLGTAYAYRLRETQEIVSNCHKVPADQFEKELLTPDEIINAIAETHALLRRRNPTLRFVLTVSPVRHIKDTLPLNAVSKSVLRVACHYLSELLPDVTYFPAYELLLDDLRDYRFYAADMIHPSSVAEDYVWERFSREYFDAAFGRFRKEWDAVRQALAHRPLHPAAPEHRQFLEATLARLQRLNSQVDVRAEMREVQKQLDTLPLPIQPRLAPEPEPEEDGEERIDIGEVENAPQPPVTPAPALVVAATKLTSLQEQESAAKPESADEVMGETPAVPYKRKRRSRGGAKRSGRKKAALLAAALADVAADVTSVSTSTTEPEEHTLPEPAPELSPSDLPTETSYVDVVTENADKVVEEANLPPKDANEAEVPPTSEAEALARPKRRTAAQVKAAKTSRKPAKTTAAKSESKSKPTRTSRRKPADEPQASEAAVVPDAPTPLPVEAPPVETAAETPPAAEPKPKKAAPKRRAPSARQKPASSADQSTSET